MTTPARSRSISPAALLLATVVTAGCPAPAPTRQAEAPPSAAPPTHQVAGPGKPNATPVGIALDLVAGGATLTVTAQATLGRVSIKLWGTRGLTGLAAELPAVADLAAGQTITVPIRFDPPAPGASLAVSVEGTSAGQGRTRVVSFLCGASTGASKPTTSDPSTGRTLRVLPAK